MMVMTMFIGCCFTLVAMSFMDKSWWHCCNRQLFWLGAAGWRWICSRSSRRFYYWHWNWVLYYQCWHYIRGTLSHSCLWKLQLTCTASSAYLRHHFLVVQRLKKVKGRHLYTATYMTISGLQCEVAYWPAMTLGGTAHVAAAHCPNERTLDPAVCSYNRPTCAPPSRTMAFTPQCSPATTRYF